MQAVFKKMKREPPSTGLRGLTATVDLSALVDGAPTEIDGFVSVFQATIDTLQGQLEVKDRQIEQLTEER